MSIAAVDTWDQAVCRKADAANLFSATELDYNPSDPDFADLTPQQHAQLADRKARIEAACVDKCFDCPLMVACEQRALEGPVAGVAGGRTESERRALNRSGQQPDLSVDLRDRGHRRQVNDLEIARLTALGKSSRYIAEQIGCAERTVVRARRRYGVSAQPTPGLHEPVAEPVTVEATVTSLPLPQSAVATPSQSGTGRIASSMQAIYAALADGRWHEREDLLRLGAAHVDSDEAAAWWVKQRLVTDADGRKVLNPAKAGVSIADRVAQGAREKVDNSLSASARNRKRTLRNPDAPSQYRLNPEHPANVGAPQVLAVAS